MTGVDAEIRTRLEAVAGTFGMVAWNTVTGERITINEHEVFPSASVIKVPLMVELFCQRDEGKLSLDEVHTLSSESRVSGSGVLKELHDGIQVTLMDLAILMIILSDNTATNILIDRVGMEPVNMRMRALGLERTTLARKMYDWDAAKAGRENLCTAHDLANLMRLMVDGRISSHCTSTEMIGIMARQQYKDKIPLLLPRGTKTANKTGSLTGVTHDVGIVYGPVGPYVLSILTKDVPDVITAERAIAGISRLVYEHFCS